MIGDLDHVGIVVADLNAARRFVVDVLGFDHCDTVEIPERLRAEFFTKGGCKLELIEVSEPVERAARLGEGVQATLEHIALQASDISGAVKALQSLAVEFEGGGTQRVGDRQIAFTVATTSQGVRYQLVEPRSSALGAPSTTST